MKSIKPDLWLIGIDETEYWQDEYKAKVGKIASLYLVDASQYTHLCSLTPSLWLRYVDFTTAKELDDTDYDEVMYGNTSTEPSNYFGLHVLNTPHKLNVTEHHIGDFPGYDDKDEYDEWFDSIVEYYQGNSFELEVMGGKWFDMEVENV